MSTQHAQYMLLFLGLVVNSDQFQISQSYTLLHYITVGSWHNRLTDIATVCDITTQMSVLLSHW